MTDSEEDFAGVDAMMILVKITLESK